MFIKFLRASSLDKKLKLISGAAQPHPPKRREGSSMSALE